jgi:hypothetical protein
MKPMSTVKPKIIVKPEIASHDVTITANGYRRNRNLYE